MNHGANLDYEDHALRNALYWTIYNACGDMTVFLLKAGAKVRKWSWLEDEGLPEQMWEEERGKSLEYIRTARSNPTRLSILARKCFRTWVISLADGKSIFPLVDRLKMTPEQRALCKLADLKPTKKGNTI